MPTLAFAQRLSLACVAVALAGCGGGDNAASPAPAPAPPGAPTPPPAPPANPPASGTGPLITSASTTGNTLTLTGSGFGTRTTAAPLHFEDFDQRTPGAAPTSFGYHGYGGFGGTVGVDATQAFSGSRSLKHQANMGPAGPDVLESFPHIGLRGFSSQELYVSYRLRFASNGSHLRQLKFNRSGMEVAGAPGSDCYGGAPKFFSSYYPTTSSGATQALGYVQGGVLRADRTSDEGWVGETAGFGGTPFTIPENTWVQVEEYYRLNDVGASNGVMLTSVNGHTNFNRTDLRLRAVAGQALNCSYLVIGMDYSINAGSTHGVTVWYDDHYLDTTRARVALANAATWEQATVRSPQPVTRWDSGAITAQLKPAGFASGSNAWVYVVHADGRVSAGSPLRVP